MWVQEIRKLRVCKVVHSRRQKFSHLRLVFVILHVAVTFVVVKNKDSHNLIAQDDMHV